MQQLFLNTYDNPISRARAASLIRKHRGWDLNKAFDYLDDAGQPVPLSEGDQIIPFWRAFGPSSFSALGAFSGLTIHYAKGDHLRDKSRGTPWFALYHGRIIARDATRQKLIDYLSGTKEWEEVNRIFSASAVIC
jgi:hypothetical protein